MEEAERTPGIALLMNWANDQDHWVRALVGAVLETRGCLSGEVITELYDLLLREKGLVVAGDELVAVPPIEHRGHLRDQEEAFRVTKLSGVMNVNALADDQDIEFNSQMTILFGENGAGKTGYVRILKQLASIRTAEAILPNIGRPGTPGPPGASIDYEIGDVPDNFAWTGEEGVHPFTQIDVFDAQGVDLRVDGELTYIYTPSELAVFRFTHDGIEAVKSKLDKARKAALPTGNPYLNKFPQSGPLYAKIEVLGSTTDLAELEALGTVADEEMVQLAPLQERVNALRSGDSGAKLQVAQSDQELLKRIDVALSLAEDFDLDEYARRLKAVRAAEAAHTHATQEALAAETIPGVLQDTWRTFIEAGEAYLNEYKTDSYPKEGDSCPYCLQGLEEAAIAVVLKYRAFCQSDLKDTLEKARAELRDLASGVCAAGLQLLAQEIKESADAKSEEDEPDKVLLAAQRFTAEFCVLQEALIKGVDLKPSELDAKIVAARLLTGPQLTDLESLVKSLGTAADERKTLLIAESAKLHALQDRITLSELLSGVRDHVANAKWAALAAKIISRFSALGRSLTKSSKIASKQLLNNNFEATFTEECNALRAPVVTLDFPGRRGQPARRKSLTPEYRLSATLSEGEQKVIALADFFAEATLRRNSTPVVLDDPVSSLDYKRMQHVVDRLVQLSAVRQVVVFTHNIWFTMELLGRFEKNRKACTYYDISEDGVERGVVSIGESPRLDTWKDKKVRLNVTLERASAEGESMMRAVLVEKGYDDLRGACEIVVERDLLQAVVVSYRPNVMVGNMTRIKFDALAAASDSVNEIFNRCCRFTGAHKQPLETLNVRPSLDKLKEDWNALKAIHSQFSN